LVSSRLGFLSKAAAIWGTCTYRGGADLDRGWPFVGKIRPSISSARPSSTLSYALLGTDIVGRDVLSRVLSAVR